MTIKNKTLAEKLIVLNNVMAWNVETAHVRRALHTPEGHRDCERMLKQARTILVKILEIEKELGI